MRVRGVGWALAIVILAGGGLVNALPAASATSGSSEQGSTILFVIDVSGSMSGSKLVAAKDALSVGIDALDSDQAAGLRAYSGSCGNGGNLLVPITADNRAELREAVDGLTAGGGTPTPEALRQAVADIPDDATDPVVVLVSDGQSTCGDPCPVAGELAAQVEFRTHTVGFQTSDAAEEELACIAETTGGQHFAADDADALAAAIGEATGRSEYHYVAFGDSITTGFSIAECNPNDDEEPTETYPYACRGEPPGAQPPATPYPERVAAQLEGPVDLERVGIWGWTAQQAADRHPDGDFDQLSTATQAGDLVTGALGVNDLHFSDPEHWLWQYRTGRAKQHAEDHLAEMEDALDEQFAALEQAKDRGADVVVTLYYNPYGADKLFQWGGTNGCSTLHGVADLLTDLLNEELHERADAKGLAIANFKGPFEGHGAGTEDPWVFGRRCDFAGATKNKVAGWVWPGEPEETVEELYDPHPNGEGTKSMAETIRDALVEGSA